MVIMLSNKAYLTNISYVQSMNNNQFLKFRYNQNIEFEIFLMHPNIENMHNLMISMQPIIHNKYDKLCIQFIVSDLSLEIWKFGGSMDWLFGGLMVWMFGRLVVWMHE